MQNVVSASISNARADGGTIYTNSNGAFAVVSMGEARLFFESTGNMVSMAHLLMDLADQLDAKQLDLADQLDAKQKEQSNG